MKIIILLFSLLASLTLFAAEKSQFELTDDLYSAQEAIYEGNRHHETDEVNYGEKLKSESVNALTLFNIRMIIAEIAIKVSKHPIKMDSDFTLKLNGLHEIRDRNELLAFLDTALDLHTQMNCDIFCH